MKIVTGLLIGAMIAAVSAAFAGAIHDAIENEDLNRVQAIVAQNPDQVDAKNPHNNTPLHLAALNGNKDIVEFLIDNGADINLGDNENSPPIVNAAIAPHFDIVKLMLDRGASPSLVDDNGMTPLHFAAIGGDPRIAELFLSRGTDANATNRNGLSPAIYAAYRGKVDVLKLLEDNGVDLHQTTGGGTSLLHGAANNGSVETCEFLISKGIDPDVADTTGRTPLFDAAERGRFEAVQFLLKNGASATTVTSEDQSPLHVAVYGDDPQILELLLNAGADPDAAGFFGYRPLHNALFGNNIESVRTLLSNGADPDVQDENGVTPLHLAAADGDLEICRLLLDNGANTEIKENHYGATPLHAASLRGYVDVVDRLLDSGADINARDNDEHTPLFYACKYGHKTTAEHLLDRGAVGEKVQRNFGPSPLLTKAMADGEAVVWYTGHSGWTVKTKNHLLIFDYWERNDPPEDYCLANGHINPSEIHDLPTTVFVSHEHRDHYYAPVFDWRESVPDITYVMGFEPDSVTGYQYIGPHQEKVIDGVKITTIESNDSGVGFLVEADGVVIYHAGDHANRQRDFSGPYLAEIEYLAEKDVDIDLAFMPISGCGFGDQEAVKLGVYRALELLSPGFFFAQHALDAEYKYREFADQAADQNFETEFMCAGHKGDRFVYKNGTIAF